MTSPSAPLFAADAPALGGSAARGPTAARPRLTINLDALIANYRTLQRAAPTAHTGAAVKADGYGLGAVPIAQALAAAGCRHFFVANADEGVALRSARAVPDDAAIHILDGLMPGEEACYSAHALTPVLNTPDQVRRWAEARSTWRAAGPSTLHIDTGMNRLGLTAADLAAVLGAPDTLIAAQPTLIMSHLACAATPEHPLNARQAAQFQNAAARVRSVTPAARLSLANSAGVFMGEAYAFDLTRPGVALYGGRPFDERADPRAPTLTPVVTLEAPILQVRTIAAGESVGYGATHTAAAPAQIATVALGYADGFLRAAGAGGYGVLAGRNAPIVGRISMDLITVDVTAHGEAARPGALVAFLGAEAALDDQADAAGTISYEFLTRLGPRCARRYIGGAA